MHRLHTTMVARPAMYTLIGCSPRERCVIERTQDGFSRREHDTAAANDWLQSNPFWEARVGPEVLFTRTFDEAAENSRARCGYLAGWPGEFAGKFDWVAPPVLNAQTRLAVEMCPATGMLGAIGYEQIEGEDLPEPTTRTREEAPAEF